MFVFAGGNTGRQSSEEKQRQTERHPQQPDERARLTMERAGLEEQRQVGGQQLHRRHSPGHRLPVDSGCPRGAVADGVDRLVVGRNNVVLGELWPTAANVPSLHQHCVPRQQRKAGLFTLSGFWRKSTGFTVQAGFILVREMRNSKMICGNPNRQL